jgi:hypothetical protein
MRAIIAACLLLPALVLAQTTVAVPQTIGYQGRLLKADGSPETGVAHITFTVYDAEAGGNAKWSELQTVVLTNGFYAVFLGSTTVASGNQLAAAFDGNERWLELQIQSDATPLAPRQRIASVAYAVTATNASNVTGGVVNATSVNAPSISATSISTSGTVANGTLSLTGNKNAGDAGAEVVVNSTAARTAGRLFDVLNNGTSKASIDYAGNLTLTGKLLGSGGASITGPLAVSGGPIQAVNGDLWAWRTGGATGALYLGSSGARYLYNDGTRYQMPGAPLGIGDPVVSTDAATKGYVDARFVVAGRVSQAGFIVQQAGLVSASVVKNGTGDYTVTVAGMTTSAVVLVSSLASGNIAVVGQVNSGNFRVYTQFSSTGSMNDAGGFNFMVSML